MWGCNLRCDGFGQANPADSSTYQLDYQTIDVTNIKRMEDLPVFTRGCDSSYSWNPKFAHLAHTGTPAEICDRIQASFASESNPGGLFKHPVSGQWTHMAFTGGEPMMNQRAIVDILAEFDARGNKPAYVTIETNGTQPIRDVFHGARVSEVFWSVSPKLSPSGESWADTIKPDVVKSYRQFYNMGQLKFVCDGSETAWDEVARAVAAYREQGIAWDVWIMPVGADIQGQQRIAAQVSDRALELGYNVAARVHTYVYGNVIGK